MTMRISMLMLGLCVACTAHAQSPTGYTDAKQRADADEASLSPAQSGPLLQAQQRALDEAIAACATPTVDTTPFVVVAELDAGGKVVRTWRDGGTPLAICVQKQINGKLLQAPPRAPFHTSFELSFTP